jgi:hypothetical protein
MEHYRDVTLCIDIMFVNRIPFFMSISRKIHFITAEVLDNQKQATLIKALRRIHGIHRKRGFRINLILGDSEFECTRGAIATDLRSELNICGEEEHVPEIERCIRTTKERTRCTYNSTTFDQYPPRMIIEMVFLCVFWLNAFPHKLGISQTLSPRAIITGLGVDYKEHCRIQFGQYVQTHEKHDNSMTSRTIGALALRPTGNQQGGYYFYSLLSGKRLHRTHWTNLPMPAEVRDRVHALARRAHAHRGLKFTDSAGRDLDALYPPDDDSDDSDYDPDDDDDSSSGSSSSSSDDSDYDPATASDNDDDDVDTDDNYNPTSPTELVSSQEWIALSAAMKAAMKAAAMKMKTAISPSTPQECATMPSTSQEWLTKPTMTPQEWALQEWAMNIQTLRTMSMNSRQNLTRKSLL